MDVNLASDLSKVVRLGVLELTGMTMPPDDGDALWDKLYTIGEQIRLEHQGKTAGQVDGVSEARALYRKIGLDPTKTRPSSEALLRRILKGRVQLA